MFPFNPFEGLRKKYYNYIRVYETYKFYDQERDSKQISYLKLVQENVFERGTNSGEKMFSKSYEKQNTRNTVKDYK